MDIQKIAGVNLVPKSALEVSTTYSKSENTLNEGPNIIKNINKKIMPEGLKGLNVDTTA